MDTNRELDMPCKLTAIIREGVGLVAERVGRYDGKGQGMTLRREKSRFRLRSEVLDTKLVLFAENGIHEMAMQGIEAWASLSTLEN
jgi:capsid portal protein